MLKLKLQYFSHLTHTNNSLEKSLMLGKIKGRRRRGHQRIRWLDGIIDVMNMNLGKLREMVRDREAWRAAVYGLQRTVYDWVTEQQQQRLVAYFLMCDNDMVIKENVLVCKVCMLMYAGLKCHGV